MNECTEYTWKKWIQVKLVFSYWWFSQSTLQITEEVSIKRSRWLENDNFHSISKGWPVQVCLFVPPGYLSCCRFIDDNQIITSSGDTTWWVLLWRRAKRRRPDVSPCLTLRSLPQCTVGHRDKSADHSFLGPQRRRHEPVPVARPAHLRVGSLWCLDQTVGHQRQHVPTDLHRPRVGHQRSLCECLQLIKGLFRLASNVLRLTICCKLKSIFY